MGNSYFKFKEFRIHQDKCAMKVCTDACLFGAIVAMNKPAPENWLDIGTGTGLLSLMVAQKNAQAKIDAVEIDTDAAAQASENISKSRWAANINVFNEDILTFNPGKKYDFIMSNPPFFKDDLKSADDAKNKARHDTSLSLEQLVHLVDAHLISNGLFAVLLPFQRVDYFIELVTTQGFYLSKQILVKQTMKHKFFRGILFFKRKETKTEYNEIFIKDLEHQYTPEFTAYLKDYYLFL